MSNFSRRDFLKTTAGAAAAGTLGAGSALLSPEALAQAKSSWTPEKGEIGRASCRERVCNDV